MRLQKLVLSLAVVAASAGYVAKIAMSHDNGVQGLVDRVTLRPAEAPPPLDLDQPDAAPVATPPAQAASADADDDDIPLPSLTFTSPYDPGPLVPDNTPVAAVRPNDFASAAAQGAPPQVGKLRDGLFTGGVADAYYGPVQVRAHVTRGKIIAVDILSYPSDRQTSRAISSFALPLLQREVVLGQKADVHVVSGATLTAKAYIQSLQSALDQAE
jgi:uncharacterized protein with FMN-binding domain